MRNGDLFGTDRGKTNKRRKRGSGEAGRSKTTHCSVRDAEIPGTGPEGEVTHRSMHPIRRTLSPNEAGSDGLVDGTRK